ncbi:hypothetical protein [Microbispora sp. NPDC049125]|uniref:hypothetical protein n=1 Tax=Microbispora sp. NPDC049125 TaxID=3154929 RepID=UPI003465966E
MGEFVGVDPANLKELARRLQRLHDLLARHSPVIQQKIQAVAERLRSHLNGPQYLSAFWESAAATAAGLARTLHENGPRAVGTGGGTGDTDAGAAMKRVHPSVISVTAGLMVIAALASCDAEPPVPSPSPSQSRVEAVHRAVECLVQKGAIGSADLDNATWFKSGKVVPNTDFNDWYSTHEQTMYDGRTLVEWTSDAQAAGSAWRCPA